MSIRVPGVPIGECRSLTVTATFAGPEPVTCTGLEWRAVGDADRLRDIVSRLAQVGNRDHHADVTRWEVVDAGPPEHEWAIWLPSGYIARPFTARAAAALGVAGAETVDGAAHPPYWRPHPTSAGGTFAREGAR